MNIAYAADDAFCQHMLVSIVSLLSHNEEEPLHFHILSDGISAEREELVREEVRKWGKEIDFYPLSDLPEKLSSRVRDFDPGRFRITALARLLLGSVLPREVTKLLYLDADTVVLRSIGGLYRRHLKGLAAMVPEPTIYPDVRERICLTAEEPYFNSGVILLNLSLWREEEMEEACFSYYNEIGGWLPFPDQDVLNHVLRGRIQALLQRYNFFSNYYYFRYGTLCKLSPWYAALEGAESYQEAKRHPVILHFAGDERPWIRGNRNHYARAYAHYLAKTPFAGAEKVEGKRLLMQLYHGMNLMTYVAPGVRKGISDLYYKRVVANKKER